MQINDDLIIKWEPKIQKMVSGVFVVGMEKDDIAQELRIATIKAAKAYDKERGVIFHTYLHTTMVNTIRTLIGKAQRQPETRSIDGAFREDVEIVPLEIVKALIDPTDYESEIYAESWLDSQSLTESEKLFMQLKLDGLTMEEITDDLKACRECIYCRGYTNGESTYIIAGVSYIAYDMNLPRGKEIEGNYAYCIQKNGESAYKIRQSLREKFSELADEYNYTQQL